MVYRPPKSKAQQYHQLNHNVKRSIKMKTTTFIQYISRATYAIVFAALVAFSGCDSLAIEEESLVEESKANIKRTTIGTVYTFADMPTLKGSNK